jgi:hypothetical protein
MWKRKLWKRKILNSKKKKKEMLKRARLHDTTTTDSVVVVVVAELPNFVRECVLNDVPAWEWLNVARVNRAWHTTVRDLYCGDASSTRNRGDLRELWFHMSVATPRQREDYYMMRNFIWFAVRQGYLRCLQLLYEWRSTQESLGSVRAVDAHNMSLLAGQLDVMQWLERVFATHVRVTLYEQFADGSLFARACQHGHLHVARYLENRIHDVDGDDNNNNGHVMNRRLRANMCTNVLRKCIENEYVDVMEHVFVKFDVRRENLLAPSTFSRPLPNGLVNLFDVAVSLGNERVLRSIKQSFVGLTRRDVNRDALEHLIADDNYIGLRSVFELFGGCDVDVARYLYGAALSFESLHDNCEQTLHLLEMHFC